MFSKSVGARPAPGQGRRSGGRDQGRSGTVLPRPDTLSSRRPFQGARPHRRQGHPRADRPIIDAEVVTVSRFAGKKLPPHWVYVPSRRQVRELLRGLAADFRRVEFGGTGRGAGLVGLLLGYLERRVVDG